MFSFILWNRWTAPSFCLDEKNMNCQVVFDSRTGQNQSCLAQVSCSCIPAQSHACTLARLHTGTPAHWHACKSLQGWMCVCCEPASCNLQRGKRAFSFNCGYFVIMKNRFLLATIRGKKWSIKKGFISREINVRVIRINKSQINTHEQIFFFSMSIDL